ncbi:hypothetical protein [Scandinavium goeteborgense]|uniref:Uncharacterized protein n=1 Tax=Scandinavium goeteborgense TaxID=1851514 RepID=A0A4R6DSH1_SCAGO|nr:hypothetical protein [Scandinavium goeteborgense]TDN48075.1 hypothetical protein EC847_12826 [Scandinavium goeteborgense]
MEPKEAQADSNPNLRNAKVFSERKMKAGIPQQMFVLLVFLNIFSLILTVKFFSVFSVFGFGVFMALTVIPVVIIHKDDRDAWVVWRKVIFSSVNLSNEKTTTRKVSFIKLSSNTGN